VVTLPRTPPLERTTARRALSAEARGAATTRVETTTETHDMTVRVETLGKGTCAPRVRKRVARAQGGEVTRRGMTHPGY
tara:strand:+ start:1314 stop:1550 length:237 start_codon:yes stop_codon:yes gene_type:complete